MMNIEELRKIFCEDGLYAVCVENGNIVSHYRIVCLQKNGAALINFVDARVTDGFILRDGEFVTSLLKWSTKTGHRVRVFPVSIFRFVWG
ncbi:hypothetical protein [Shigella flexneri]|uniref:hypothetical protein n=1 Tax=Shigella flexneri TaxID=623 RepID=UPI0020966B79|nr:hypothetical protein [Shigella flexneri]